MITAKNLDGYCLWPSRHAHNWNSAVIGPKQDVVGDIRVAIRRVGGLRFGIYYAMADWTNADYQEDLKTRNTQLYSESVTMPQLNDLVISYLPDILWVHSSGELSFNYWNSTQFLTWLYNDSPVKDTIIVNDQWGTNTQCQHGGFYTCRKDLQPKNLPKTKWARIVNLDKFSRGYRRETKLADIKSTKSLIKILAQTISYDGNIIFNVGITGDGRICPIYEGLLRDLGSWLEVNGEAVYKTTIYADQKDSDTKNVWYTARRDGDITIVYAIVLNWPEGNSLHLGSMQHLPCSTIITLLGYEGEITWDNHLGKDIGIEVIFPNYSPKMFRHKYGFVLKMV